jgi:hypothetical protein
LLIAFFFILRYYKFVYPLFLKNTLRQLILEPSDYLRAETWQSSCRARVKEHIKLILKIIGVLAETDSVHIFQLCSKSKTIHKIKRPSQRTER